MKKIDIGCGDCKEDGWIGMDYRKLQEVDIVQDLEEFPWWVNDEEYDMARCNHVVEHINPCKGTFIKFMDEVWRILKPGSEFHIETPYAPSKGFFRDPTHCNPCNEETWDYFTPEHPLYYVYQPKPWVKKHLEFDEDNIKVILIKQ